jgi:hypothetical protein
LIVRQYGTKVQSVVPAFDALAITEIVFRRDRQWSMGADAFLDAYDRTETHELTAAAEGGVQHAAKEALLHSLEQQLLAVAATVGDGVLLVEADGNAGGPKTRQTQLTQLVQGRNRLFFRYAIEPPLRVSVFRRR